MEGCEGSAEPSWPLNVPMYTSELQETAAAVVLPQFLEEAWLRADVPGVHQGDRARAEVRASDTQASDVSQAFQIHAQPHSLNRALAVDSI